MNQAFFLRKQIEQKINNIPKKNRIKFQNDYIKLIELAQKDNYENIEIPDC